jgi:nucleoside-diphosphate-sugar epimerase
MRILLTGASGFIGRSTAKALRRAGHEVIVVTRGETPKGAQAALRWDITQEPPRAAITFDTVVHLAQSRIYRDFPADARQMFDVNVLGLQRLLDFAASTGAQRFCLISSGTVYEPYDRPLREDEPGTPNSYLGASKLAAEVLAKPYAGLFALSVLRLFSPYGLGQEGRLIPDLIERVREGKTVVVGADGEGLRLAPTHVDDIAGAIVTAVEQSWTGTLNVAAPIDVSIRQIADLIGHLMQRQPVFAKSDRPSLRIVPELGGLAERYALNRFRKLSDGLAAMIGAPREEVPVRE